MGALLLLEGSVEAQNLNTSARQLPQGSLKVSAYYQGEQDQALNFNVNNSGSCSSPNGSVGFGCDQSGSVEAKGHGGQGLVKMVYQPWDSFQYYAVGGLGSYSLNVPSTTITNQLTGDTPGWILGAGVKAVLAADTQFTPAIAVDASLTHSQYAFNRRFPGGGSPTQNNDVNQQLGLWQYQVAIEASHLFTIVDAVTKQEQKETGLALVNPSIKLEPYGGVKWTRTQADLHDLQDGSHAGGQQDTISPFVGLRIPAYDHEAFFAEASFVDGYVYSGGMEIRFK